MKSEGGVYPARDFSPAAPSRERADSIYDNFRETTRSQPAECATFYRSQYSGRESGHSLQRPHLRPAHPRHHPRTRKRRRLLPALGRTGSRLAAPNPHRTLLPGNHGHLPVVAPPRCRERAADLHVHRIRRRTVQDVGVRCEAARATRALLPHRHRGHEAVTTGAPGPPAAARKTRAGAASAASRAAGSAPRLSNVGRHAGPSHLLFHTNPGYPLATSPPDL